MTTAIAREKEFIAVDSKWSLSSAPRLELVDHPIKKYVYSDQGDVLTLFAGDELPILLYQAKLLDIITSERFLSLITRAATHGAEVEQLSLDATDGEFLSAAPAFTGRVAYLGSGGEYAALFNHASRVESSYEQTNECCIERALKFAYLKDNRYSGGEVSKKIWLMPSFDNTIDTETSAYKSLLLERLRILIMLIGTPAEAIELAAAKKGVVPPLRTSPAGSVTKVSVSSAIDFLNEQQDIRDRILSKRLARANS
ncbi:hypothetical protein [Vibrio lentus]|uniref:hypothetical protein n=1 Tax=Vibrio lentus TaxID=136468 RepID=UPI000C82B05D|nr:hypothetical protein [Vibrio lentus]PMJ62035.1 hypothetical protein BCU18_23425 [Vibrio lentus]